MRKVLILVFGFFIVFIGCSQVRLFPKYDYKIRSTEKETDLVKETKMSMPKIAPIAVVKK